MYIGRYVSANLKNIFLFWRNLKDIMYMHQTPYEVMANTFDES